MTKWETLTWAKEDIQLYSIARRAIRRSLPIQFTPCSPKKTVTISECLKRGGLYSEMLYIGFWTDKGNADKSTLTLLSTLKNKKDLSIWNGGLWRQRGIFPEDSQSCQAVYRFKQFRGRRIYVSGQNAAVCTGTLHENEGTAGASGKYRCAD